MVIKSIEKSDNKTRQSGRFLSLFLLWQLKEPQHGYSLIEIVNSLGINPCKQSTIYSILNKLEKKGFVESKKTEIGKKFRKVYKTTEKGRNVLSNVKKNRMKGKLREFMEFLLS